MTSPIPQHLINAGARFIRLKQHGGMRKHPLDTQWNTVNNFAADDPILIEHITLCKGNYGVLPVNGVCQMDIDNNELFREHRIVLPQSFTVKRGNHGHYYFTCSDCPDKMRRKHILDFGDVRLGMTAPDEEGKTKASFVVGPGCVHPSGDIYEVRDNVPLVDLPYETVLKIITDWGKVSVTAPKRKYSSHSESIPSQIGLIMDDFLPTNATSTASGWVGANPWHGSINGKNYTVDLQKGIWGCSRCKSGGGALEAYCVSKGIINCEDAHRGCLDGKWHEIFSALEDDGYELDPTYDPECASELMKNMTIRTECDIETDHVGLTQEQIDENIRADEVVANAYLDGNDLPGLPNITHPLFKEWMDISKKLSYSRVPYHFGALLTILSAGVGRRVCLRLGMDTVYPNVFVMIAGITSISGKSTACKNAKKNLLPSVINADVNSEYNQADNTGDFGDDSSDAALVQGLADINNLFWYYDDCKSFFDTTEEWNKPILPRLCKIYDGEGVSRRLSRRNKESSTVFCETPYLSLLFNMTTTQLKDVITGNLWNSGFAPRLMWFIENGGELRENIDADADDLKIIATVATRIKNVATSLKEKTKNDSVVFKVNPTIEQWKIRKTKEYGSNEKYQTALARGFIHVYKMAMIFTVYDEKFDLDTATGNHVLPEEWVREAISIEENYLFPRMIKVIEMAEKVSRENDLDIIIDKLKELGGVATHGALIKRTRFKLKEFKTAMDALLVSGEVEMVNIHTASSHSVVKYCLTNKTN